MEAARAGRQAHQAVSWQYLVGCTALERKTWGCAGHGLAWPVLPMYTAATSRVICVVLLLQLRQSSTFFMLAVHRCCSFAREAYLNLVAAAYQHTYPTLVVTGLLHVVLTAAQAPVCAQEGPHRIRPGPTPGTTSVCAIV